jgi:hypothetical protein
MEQLIMTLPGSALEDDDRRQRARFHAAIPIVVAPLDEDFRPVAPAFNAASIDISATGISFVVKSECSASYWMVDLGQEAPAGTQAIMQIARIESLGEGCWKAAGPFITERDPLPKQEKLLYG